VQLLDPRRRFAQRANVRRSTSPPMAVARTAVQNSVPAGTPITKIHTHTAALLMSSTAKRCAKLRNFWCASGQKLRLVSAYCPNSAWALPRPQG
jgi:hypothetical protein